MLDTTLPVSHKHFIVVITRKYYQRPAHLMTPNYPQLSVSLINKINPWQNKCEVSANFKVITLNQGSFFLTFLTINIQRSGVRREIFLFLDLFTRMAVWLMASPGSTHSTFTLEMTISGPEPSSDIDYAH